MLNTEDPLRLVQRAIDCGVSDKNATMKFVDACKSFGFDPPRNYESMADLMDDYLRERKKHLYEYKPYLEREV